MARESFALRRETGGGELRPGVGSGGEFNSALRSEATYIPSQLVQPQVGLTVEDLDHSTVRVAFDPEAIADDPTFGAWTEAVIIKSSAGVPVTSLGGTRILHVVNSVDGLAQFEGGWVNTLDGGLAGGRWVYYALFARFFNAGNVYWLKVGEASYLNPQNYDYSDRFWRLIPEYYRSQDASLHAGGGLLRRIIDGLGREFDVARTWASTVGDVWDFSKISARLLPEAAHALGQPLEAAAGDKRMRNLLSNLMALRKMKGTIDGIEGYISAITGYRVKAYSGLNLLLQHDSAEATTTTGAWSSTVEGGSPSGTITRVVSGSSPANGPPTGTPFIRNTNSTGAGTRLGMSLPVYTDYRGMVPVTPTHQYKFSVAMAYSGTSVAFEVAFVWRDINGVTLSTSTEAIGSYSSGTWVRAKTGWVTAPASAAFVQIILRTVNAGAAPNTSTLSIWRAQLADKDWYPEGVPGAASIDPLSNAGAATTSYEHPDYYEAPKVLHISVFPRRSNLARNATFALDGNSGGSPVADAWSLDDPATMELIPVAYPTFDDIPVTEESFLDLQADLDPLVSTASITYDTGAGTLTLAVSTSPYKAAVRSHYFPVMETEDMSAAVTAYTSVPGTKMRLKMRWFAEKSSTSAIIRDDGTVAEDISNEYELPVAGTTQRFSITNARPPVGTAFGRLSVEISNTISCDVVLQDVLIEPAATPGPFFDGNNTEGDFGDFFWANGKPQHEAESVYYPAFRSFITNPGGSARVTAIVNELVPAGTVTKLLTATNGLFPT